MTTNMITMMEIPIHVPKKKKKTVATKLFSLGPPKRMCSYIRTNSCWSVSINCDEMTRMNEYTEHKARTSCYAFEWMINNNERSTIFELCKYLESKDSNGKGFPEFNANRWCIVTKIELFSFFSIPFETKMLLRYLCLINSRNSYKLISWKQSGA